MVPEPDKECEEPGDIVLLLEIITNSIYRQVFYRFGHARFLIHKLKRFG